MSYRRFVGFASPSGVQVEEDQQGVDLQWGVKVPMRDGIHLNATVYKPASIPEPLPVIIGLTPYTADVYHKRAFFFAQNGYIFAAVDCRGRGNSEGIFEPVINEGRDGYDLVEWFAQQPYCNGKVTMSGASYGGFDQWSTVRERPVHLKTVIPTASGYPSFDFPFPNNIFMTYFIQWLTLTSGKPTNFNLFGEFGFWGDKQVDLYKDHRALSELDEIAGNTSTFYQTWMENLNPGPYWDQALPQEEHYRQVEIPILTITGHYDGDQKGAIQYYREHMRWGSPEALANHYLVIGPWDHGGTGNPQKSFGGLTFGDSSVLDMHQLHKGWYDWRLKGAEKPEFLQKRVAYYVVQADEWKYADTLEEVGKEKQSFYLSSFKGKANDVFESGLLQTALPAETEPDQFVYDPLDIRPGELENEVAGDFYQDYLLNQRFVLNLFDNGLVYHTEPFEEDMEVSGFVKFKAWVELDVPDTDFEVTLYEILKDGTSIMLTQDMKRARYRESLREETLVPVGKVIEYTFDGFTFFSRLVQKGSRLRLVFKCVNSISWGKNYNSGRPAHLESGKDARTAHVKLYHDSTHPSVLEIPLGQ
jgi:putative CocE/NonD family hydrolase